MFCAPGIKQKLNTCFDRAALVKIINSYNHKYPQKKIQYSDQVNETQLWSLIRDSMAGLCGDNEWCWLDQDFLKSD